MLNNKYASCYSCVQYSMQAFSSDGRWLISSSVDSTVKTWDLPSGKYDFLHLVLHLGFSVNKK